MLKAYLDPYPESKNSDPQHCFLAVFRIWIEAGIQAVQKFPQRKKKHRNFMFEKLFFGLEASPGA